MLLGFDPEVAALAVASLCLVLVLMVTFTAGVRYQLAFDRLPAATRLQELEVLVASGEARLQDVRERLKRAEVALSERDQAEAEAEFWRAAVQTAKAEYAALENQRREIEDTREQHRQVLENLTLAETQLRQVKADAEQAHQQAEALEERASIAEQRRLEIEKEGEALHASFDDLQRAIAEAHHRLTSLKEERDALGAEVERSRDRLVALKAACDEHQERLAGFSAARASYEAELERLQPDIEKLPALRAEVEEVRRALSELRLKRDALEQSIDTLQQAESRLQARVAKLENELGAAIAAEGDENSLADLTKIPACLAVEREGGELEAVFNKPLPDELESQALQRVMDHLHKSGLEFPARTVNAFHTSLKTAVISPLTVLAGISGTGKSQLPRYYAGAMGFHFLKIPVQPRWDGPQDLFGFYNYIEKRYKATDLARALVHLDRFNWPDEAERFQDRMLLVLLDEMNLARIEYYFSEFLSRLEGRPYKETGSSESDRRPSEMDIDVSRSGQTKRVYAGQNVLFVGTMNEDESTLTLSDKVLDRANVLRFPRPQTLKDSLLKSDRRSAAPGYLSRSRWANDWIVTADRLASSERDRASRTIDAINAIMNELGRPFGHRMGQAMLHYVANYPVASSGASGEKVDCGLADQIEQRIMPKLRGIVVDNHRRELLELARLASSELNDKELSQEIEDSVTRARETNGLFVWRGFVRRS